MRQFRTLVGLTPEDYREQLAEASALTDEVVARHPKLAMGHETKGLILRERGQLREARAAHQRAIELDPNLTSSYVSLAFAWIHTGKPGRALPLIDSALARNPQSSMTGVLHYVAGLAQTLLGQYDAAIAALLRGRQSFVREALFSHLAAAYAMSGEMAKAEAELAEYCRLIPGITLARLRALGDHQEPAYARVAEDTLFAGLRKAGLPEG